MPSLPIGIKPQCGKNSKYDILLQGDRRMDLISIDRHEGKMKNSTYIRQNWKPFVDLIPGNDMILQLL